MKKRLVEFLIEIAETGTAEEERNSGAGGRGFGSVSYTHLRAHETVLDLVCRLLLEKKQKQNTSSGLTISTKR